MRWACWLVVGLVGLAFVACEAAPTVSRTAVERLDELNRILDEILEGIESATLGETRNLELLEEAMTAFGGVLAAMPVAGLLYSDVFGRLYDVLSSLDEAAEILETKTALSPYSLYLAFRTARWAKDQFKWQLSGGLLTQQLACPSGHALVIVYPGFDCHALRNKLRELVDAGKCVTVAWREPDGYVPPAQAPLDYGPNAIRLYDCLGTSFPTGPAFDVRRAEAAASIAHTEEYSFGDPSAAAHVSTPPVAPHPALVDSALASDVRGGEPTRIDPTRALHVDDVVKPWYAVNDLCRRVDVEWRYYDPTGSLVYTDSSTLDPADHGSPCLSRFSSAGWTTLGGSLFGAGGTYAVELWIDGRYSALHRFTMAGAGPLAPIVFDDFYVADEDGILDAADRSLTSNDVDPNFQPLTTVLDSGPAHGALVLGTDGRFTYTPDPDYFGVDWFAYRATDSAGLQAAGDVTILVNPANDPPVVGDDRFDVEISPEDRTWTLSVPALGWSQTGTLDEDGVRIEVPAPGVLLNDADPDGDLLSADAASAPGWLTMRADGSLVIEISELGTVPELTRLTYRAVDPGGLSATGELEIHVTVHGSGG